MRGSTSPETSALRSNCRKLRSAHRRNCRIAATNCAGFAASCGRGKPSSASASGRPCPSSVTFRSLVLQQRHARRKATDAELERARREQEERLQRLEVGNWPRPAAALGYPSGQVRRATVRADAVLRARRPAPYLADVAAAAHRADWTTPPAAPAVQHPANDLVVGLLVLDVEQTPPQGLADRP